MNYLTWREAFAQGMDQRFYPIEYLDGLVAAGEVFFWFGEQAAVCGRLKQYPGSARVLEMLVGAGDLTEILNVLRPRLEAWAKAWGCSHVLVESREGWAKALKIHGYEPWQVAVMKEL